MTTRFICDHCGSEDIVIDAAARWSVETQEFKLSSTQDCVTCNDCGREGYGAFIKADRAVAGGWRLAQNVSVNRGFYIRPADNLSFSPARVFVSPAEAWTAHAAEV